MTEVHRYKRQKNKTEHMDSTYVPEEHNGTGATKTIFTDTVEENFLR